MQSDIANLDEKYFMQVFGKRLPFALLVARMYIFLTQMARNTPIFCRASRSTASATATKVTSRL